MSYSNTWLITWHFRTWPEIWQQKCWYYNQQWSVAKTLPSNKFSNGLMISLCLCIYTLGGLCKLHLQAIMLPTAADPGYCVTAKFFLDVAATLGKSFTSKQLYHSNAVILHLVHWREIQYAVNCVLAVQVISFHTNFSHFRCTYLTFEVRIGFMKIVLYVANIFTTFSVIQPATIVSKSPKFLIILFALLLVTNACLKQSNG